MKRSESTGNKTAAVILAVLIAAVWEIVVDAGLVPPFILPSPSSVLLSVPDVMPVVAPHLLITLKEAFAGFFTAVFLALMLAVLMDSVRLVKKAVYPLLIISQTIPIIALAPLFVLWFGFGPLPKVIVVVLVCFFPIVVSLLDGLDSVDEDMIIMLKSMGAGRLQMFRLLKFPASMVNFFSGLRIAATYSIMGAVIGEWLGGEGGLGVYMMNIKRSYSTSKMFVVILIIVVLSMALFRVITIAQNIAMPWNRFQNKNSGRE